ncbi:MAG: hypothetical protein JWL61_3429 [Gemmatimonadetes bacterium]|jgi:hypothetical protein|nr:hypothetical protein [Gemmatimonadota bacterium]
MTLCNLAVTFFVADRTDPRPSAMVVVVGGTYVSAGIEPM